jgi:hypothetical protein
MHPDEIEALEHVTAGARVVFRFLRVKNDAQAHPFGTGPWFLQETARPDGDFNGWYEPTIGEQGQEPDFVLFGTHQGLLVLEVKDS